MATFNAALSAGSPFSAVVTDFRIADLDGLAVAAGVKAVSPATTVVLLTAHTLDAHDLLRNVDCYRRTQTPLI